MERLTDRNADGSAFYKACFAEVAPCGGGMPGEACAECGIQQKQCDKLAAYEDLSDRWKQSIEQMDTVFRRVNALGGTDLMEQYRDIGDIDDLTDLVKARDEGRTVVLPCSKSGAELYFISKFTGEIYKEAHTDGIGLFWTNESDIGDYIPLACIGKTVFLTRDEAEAALKGAVEHEAN